MPLFQNLLKHRPKSSKELVSRVRGSVLALAAVNEREQDTPLARKELERLSAEAAENVELLHAVLLSDVSEGDGVSPAEVKSALAEVLETDTLQPLSLHLAALPFEARKQAAAIFTFVCKYRVGGSAAGDIERAPGLEWLQGHPEIEAALLSGYEDAGIALSCGAMLREAIRDAVIAERLLTWPALGRFFDFVQMAAFEVASDAFNTFRRLLTLHTAVVDAFLAAHHEHFFSAYEALLSSDNYATQRQSLALLSEVLMAGDGRVVPMWHFTRSPRRLMLVMNLMRAPSRTIQAEAFHVFKLFVANPRKATGVRRILYSNRAKLLRFLDTFLIEREAEYEDFAREKAELVAEITSIVAPTDGESASGALHRSPSSSDPMHRSQSFGDLSNAGTSRWLGGSSLSLVAHGGVDDTLHEDAALTGRMTYSANGADGEPTVDHVI